MEKLLTIREMCAQFGVTARALRFYEAKELIKPKRAGQKRLYSRREVGRLKLILRGKHVGFSLEDIRQLLDLYDIGDGQVTQYQRAYELGQKHLADLLIKREELDDAIRDLQEQMAWGAQLISSLDLADHSKTTA